MLHSEYPVEPHEEPAPSQLLIIRAKNGFIVCPKADTPIDEAHVFNKLGSIYSADSRSLLAFVEAYFKEPA
jgi:hypothetical protein